MTLRPRPDTGAWGIAVAEFGAMYGRRNAA